MSIECGECERDLRGGHADDCSRKLRLPGDSWEAVEELRESDPVAAEAMRRRLRAAEWDEQGGW